MITLFFFVRLAVRSLRRGGQRVLVALLCITFGITALVALTMLAKSIERTVRVTPSELIGGDLSLVRKNEETLRLEDIEQLKALQQRGALSRYTLLAYNSASIMFRTPRSGEMHFVGLGMGIEPDQYPLAGSLAIGEPVGAGLPSLLQRAGDVVITRDIALEYGLKIGDPITLSDLRSGPPLQGIVRGVAYDTPNHQGDKLYYTIATAQQLAGSQAVLNTVIANSNQPEAAMTALENSGWSVDWLAGRRDGNPANAWVMGLRGAGILGLLVGGIGIANTMFVLLRRRQAEIAIWKALGYREGHLRLIFMLEAGLLGLTGSLLGAGLGILISGQVLELIRRMSSVLYQWSFSATPPLLGILVGTLTTVIFAAWAIVVTSQASPMALLRGEWASLERRSGCFTSILALILAVPLTILASLVMESVLAGILVLIGIAMGIAVLGGFFKVVLWVCAHLLALRRFPLLRMAFNSLRRRGGALVFAMIALFVGVLSMSVGLAVAQFSELKIAGQSPDFQSYNLNILARGDQEPLIRRTIAAQHPEKVGVGYRTALKRLSVVGDPKITVLNAVLVGRSDPEDYLLSGAGWGNQPDGVYVDHRVGLPAGSQVAVTLMDGTTKTLTVVGSYAINDSSISLEPPSGLLISVEGFTRVTRPDALTYFVQVDPSQISRTADALGTALPQATVVDLVAFAARFMHSYQKLFVLPIAISGLALLAGCLLVANAVSLAMQDRRYEIGILKAVGYTRRQILAIFAAEYGLVGLLATGAGVLLIQGMLAVAALANHVAPWVLLLNPLSLALIAFCGIGLTLLTVCGIAWKPTSVSPVVVLNAQQ